MKKVIFKIIDLDLIKDSSGYFYYNPMRGDVIFRISDQHLKRYRQYSGLLYLLLAFFIVIALFTSFVDITLLIFLTFAALSEYFFVPRFYDRNPQYQIKIDKQKINSLRGTVIPLPLLIFMTIAATDHLWGFDITSLGLIDIPFIILQFLAANVWFRKIKNICLSLNQRA